MLTFRCDDNIVICLEKVSYFLEMNAKIYSDELLYLAVALSNPVCWGIVVLGIYSYIINYPKI